MISLISSFEISNFIICKGKTKGCQAESEGWLPDTNIFLWTAASVSDAAAVNPNWY